MLFLSILLITSLSSAMERHNVHVPAMEAYGTATLKKITNGPLEIYKAEFENGWAKATYNTQTGSYSYKELKGEKFSRYKGTKAKKEFKNLRNGWNLQKRR